MKPTFLSEFMQGVRQSPRLFFAPVVGAIKEVRSVVDEQIEENRARWAAMEADEEKTKKND